MGILKKILLRISDTERFSNAEEIVPFFPETNSIPKRIHQIYITPQDTNKSLPQALQENIAYTRSLNPNWEHKVWRNKEIETFILQHYGEKMLQCYHLIDPSYGAIKADLFRYLLMYKEGGVYIDLKCLFSRPLDELIREDDRYILSHWDNGKGESHEGWGQLFPELAHIERGEYIMGFIVSVEGHPFVRETLLSYVKNISRYNPHRTDVGFGGTMRITGPIIYTLAIEKAKKVYPNISYREVEIVKDWGFEYFPHQTATIIKTDYRKSYKPIIPHPKLWVQNLNSCYFHALALYRKYILKA